MREILVDQARRKASLKRSSAGGGALAGRRGPDCAAFGTRPPAHCWLLARGTTARSSEPPSAPTTDCSPRAYTSTRKKSPWSRTIRTIVSLASADSRCQFATNAYTHIYIVVSIDPDVANGSSDEEGVLRWERLFPPRRQIPEAAAGFGELGRVPSQGPRMAGSGAATRSQSLSPFMKCLKEPRSRLANRQVQAQAPPSQFSPQGDAAQRRRQAATEKNRVPLSRRAVTRLRPPHRALPASPTFADRPGRPPTRRSAFRRRGHSGHGQRGSARPSLPRPRHLLPRQPA